MKNARRCLNVTKTREQRHGMATGSSSTVRTRVRETANGLRSSRNMQTLLIREWATLGREWLHLGIREPWTVGTSTSRHACRPAHQLSAHAILMALLAR